MSVAWKRNGFLCDKPTAVAQVQINADGQNRICVIPSANFEFGFDELDKVDTVIKNWTGKTVRQVDGKRILWEVLGSK